MSASNFMNVLGQLWHDDAAAVHSAEIILIMLLLVIGMIVGMTSLRDAGVTEFADFGQALSNLNQSYSYSGLTISFMIDGETATIVTTGSEFEDERDFCDLTDDQDVDDTANPSRCVEFCIQAPTPATGFAGEMSSF